MGRVWRARDVILDMEVALKVVRPDLAADHRFRTLFDLEVRMAARFTHPHIVPLHDLGELADGTPFLGLALAEDGSFANLRSEMPPWEEILRLTLELLDALGHLHARGVLHRDLKPENVLLNRIGDGRRHVWLADLGLANAAGTLAKKKGRVEGTPGFMAPEQRLGLPREYGPWTDLYSVGVILWELVTNQLPFPDGRSPLDSELAPLLPRPGLLIPQGLDLVLANLLDAEPLSRYDLAADLQTELLALGPAEIDTFRAKSKAKQRRTLIGTVAPSAPSPSSSPPSYVSKASASPATGSAPTGSRATIAFDEEAETPSGPVFQLGVPAWNRPRPRVLPARPPSEQGRGATARGSLPLFAVRELPLVARDDYRQLLWNEALRTDDSGLARVVVVVGEAGAGKTRLVESVVRSLQEGGWAETITMAYQRPAGKEDGYAGAARAIVRPWNETRESLEARLRRRLARERGLIDGVVHEEAAMLARWSGLLKEGEEPVAAGYGLRAVYRYLEARSWRGIACLLLDDAQWATEEGDGLSIAEAMLQSAQDGEQKKLLLLATVRSEDLSKDQQLSERVDHLVALGATRIDLPRLDRRGTRELLKESLTLAPDLAERVAERCEGNPLFARQLILEWADRGWLVNMGGLQYSLAPGVDPDTVLPADAEALFRERVSAIAESSGDPARFRDVLHMAALTGMTLPKGVLKSLAGEELYEYLRRCGLFTDQQDVLKFDHGLLHQSLRADAESRTDGNELHWQIARAWAAYGDHSGEDVHLQVGLHAHAGEVYALALEHLLDAAEAAWRRGRTKEVELAAELAIDCCQKDRDLKNRGGWPRIWRARACEVEGDAQAAGDLYYRARMMFQQDEDADGVIESYIGMGWSARQTGKIQKAERHYSDAMKRARSLGELRLEAAAIYGLAWVEQQKRNFDGADILFTRVLNRYAQIDDQRGQAEATLGQAFVARRIGNFDDAEDLYEESAQMFQEGEDLLGIARALCGRGIVARQRLLVDRSEELFKEAGRIAEELGATQLLMEARIGMADLLRLRNERRRAGSIYRAHARWAERQHIFEAAITARLLLALLALLDEDLDAMYRESSAAASLLEKVPGHWLWAQYRLVVATMLALRSDADQTYRWLWSAAELGLGDTVDHDNAYLLTVICHVAAERQWQNTMRVAGKLAVNQWQRLGRKEEAQMVTQLATQLLGTALAQTFKRE